MTSIKNPPSLHPSSLGVQHNMLTERNRHRDSDDVKTNQTTAQRSTPTRTKSSAIRSTFHKHRSYSRQGTFTTSVTRYIKTQKPKKGQSHPPRVVCSLVFPSPPPQTTGMKLAVASLVPLIASVSCASARLSKRDFKSDAIAIHNSYRAQYGASPLSWDDNLANQALDYARQCDWNAWKQEGAGTNLHFATGTTTTIQDAVKAWMDEVSQYSCAFYHATPHRYTPLTNVLNKDNHPHFEESTGHFTQVVWKSTTAVGCGLAVCNNEDPLGNRGTTWTNIACRYAPQGNIDSREQFEDNVGRPQ
ncbi:hypothetical protein NP233_g7566 [Leucocoprinus birnbaumii]|uniref:SCP domain-containing protein n=1 Tax=Leucocoprinus birnbaumii TaxID=56174 RepID=A0AAD5VP28_9AGAR|nr:hypothetical protein NP233_g7566 [Leucocoprinus birnbaumii]